MTDSVPCAPPACNVLSVRHTSTDPADSGPGLFWPAVEWFEGRCTCGFETDRLNEWPGECPACGTDEVDDPDGYHDPEREPDYESDDDWRGRL